MHDLENRVHRLGAAFPNFSEDLHLAYGYIVPDAASSLTKSRVVLERLLLGLYAATTGREPKKPLLGDMLQDNQFTRKIDRRICARMNAVRDMGNLGPHGEAVRACDAERVLEDLCEILDWHHQQGNGASPAFQAPDGVEPVGADVVPPARRGEDQGGNGAGVQVATDMARIELVIDGDFDSFSPEKQERVLRAIKELLGGGGEIRLVSKRRGSVRLTLEMTPEQAERLLWAVKRGELADAGVADARLIGGGVSAHAPSPSVPPSESSSQLQPDPDAGRQPGAPPSGPAGARLLLAPGARPLPTYDLVRVLGRGDFGEVWEATGPGGVPVALKFVRREAHADRAEMDSLEMMKDIRHPHLLLVFGAWERDGYLIVAMELADGTLLQRLQEAQARGLPGIPPGELLGYMRDAATAIDFLNDRRQPFQGGTAAGIQHKDTKPQNLDIKPQNLLLVGGAIKVADFGLAKRLEDTHGSSSGAMSPAYAAPEFLRYQATSQSDQYALAVSYCQLRGGRLPFRGNNMLELIHGHLSAPPDLGMIPEEERPAVSRALAKDPEKRWPNCQNFVEALAAAVRQGTCTLDDT
jgi:hypothetical protein